MVFIADMEEYMNTSQLYDYVRTYLELPNNAVIVDIEHTHSGLWIYYHYDNPTYVYDAHVPYPNNYLY